jgi:Ca2+-transporting ATPase
MPAAPEQQFDIKGLSAAEVISSRQEHGPNSLDFKRENYLTAALKKLLAEPMIILLLAASSVYFITGNNSDGIFMISAIILVSATSLFHDARSNKSLNKLKELSAPHCKVIREHKTLLIPTDDVVVGDHIIAEEGTMIPADGKIVSSNDFSVDESALTGESLSVSKNQESSDNMVYKGTTVVGGLAIALVTATGNNTKLGRVGRSLVDIKEEKTPLELQIRKFVKNMMFAGLAIFIIVWLINFFASRDVADSLLKALTLAMSIVPEEIPVAFTTFMALGAWRLSKMGVIAKQMKTVETLGSATVICTDKTGTITENRMSLAKLYTLSSNKIKETKDMLSDDEKALLETAMWASEPVPFDPMEIAIHRQYSFLFASDQRKNYKMIHEYPLSGKPPMMTHIFENAEGGRIIAAKGAPEALMAISDLSEAQREQLQVTLNTMMSDGHRVLAVGSAHAHKKDFPQLQQEFRFDFKGLLAFYDPPKKNIKKVLEQFYDAGIDMKIITGDNAATTAAIAREIGFRGANRTITGEELMKVPQEKFAEKVHNTTIFSRMYPEAKLKVIEALKSRGHVVAMTGDGINDGPALKAAHIGIAMGRKGTEIAKDAASLVLMEDDLSKMVDAVAMGRKIYNNLKKAIRYIISIHIPIILTVLLPLVLGWLYPNIFSPVHIIFLELIMGPTCSVIYENEPLEESLMKQRPRKFTKTFFNAKELGLSIAQGLAITAGTLLIYQYGVGRNMGEDSIRTLVFITIVSANIFLTLVNRSFYSPVWETIRWKNRLVPLIIGITILLSASILYIKPAASFFGFEAPETSHLLLALFTGFLSVIWYEAVKFAKRRFSRQSQI